MATTKKKAAGKKSAKDKKGGKRPDIRLGPRYEKEVRVPINATQYSKKESEIAQLEIVVAKTQRLIAPDQKIIRDTRKKIAKLTLDLEENTEPRKMMVRNEYHDNQNMTRVLRADNGAAVEERPMTDKERQIDVEDEIGGGDKRETDEEPASTPGEAMKAARDEEDEEKIH